MKGSLFLAGFAAALFAFGCGDQGTGLTPPDPSFDRPPRSCLENAESQVGSVFSGSFKNGFKDLLDTSGDGKISEDDAFEAAIRISIAFDPQEADFWSDPAIGGDAALAAWANSLGNRTTEADAAELVRLIFACAVLGDDGTLDTGDEGWRASASEVGGFDFRRLEDDGQFVKDIEKALTRTGEDFDDYTDFGAFAVRNPLVDRSTAVTSPNDSNSEPYWGVEPQTGDSWYGVFGDDAGGSPQQVLIFGFATSTLLNGEATQEGGAYNWNVLPAFDRFDNDVVVGTCQAGLPVGGSGGQANTVRVLRQLNVTTSTTGDPSFCYIGFRAAGSESSFFSSLASAVGRLFRPAELQAGAALSPGGRGGLAINWSVFDIATIGAVELVFENQPCKDQLEDNWLDFEPCDDPPVAPTPEDFLVIKAQTVTGLAIEEICVSVDAVDNNGTGKNLVGTQLCTPATGPASAKTQDDGVDPADAGKATFAAMKVTGRGGFRLRASADGFPDTDSDGFNARPVNQ